MSQQSVAEWRWNPERVRRAPAAACIYASLYEEAAMRQFTMNIDDGLLRAAKAHALNAGRSVSEIVRDLLAREVGWATDEAPAPLEAEQVRSVLLAYSEGRTSRRQAMDALALAPERYPDFVEAMNTMAVPWPRPDPEQIEREADILVQAMSEPKDAD
jgi:plasmid stability protein